MSLRKLPLLALVVLSVPVLPIGTPAQAAADESVSNRLILPLVVFGRIRESVVHISNPTGAPLFVDASYRGMQGTPEASADVPCDRQSIPATQSISLPLSRLCPNLRSPDLEFMGYLRLDATGDAWALISASQTTTVRRSGIEGMTFSVQAEPLGALDFAAPIVNAGPTGERLRPLQVYGLGGEVVGNGVIDRRSACWVAAPDKGKELALSVVDSGGKPQGSLIKVQLGDGEMQRIDVLKEAGFAPGQYENLSVLIYSLPAAGTSFSRETVLAGCGSEHFNERSLTYRLARSWEPADNSRRRFVEANSFANVAGPFSLGSIISPSTADGAASDSKIELAVFVQPEDRLSCDVEHTDQRIEERAWLELRILDPDGNVIAGGDTAKRTGVFETGSREQFAAWGNAPWRIEISLDEAMEAMTPWNSVSNRQFGLWGLYCESAAGMSVPAFLSNGIVPAALSVDDF